MGCEARNFHLQRLLRASRALGPDGQQVPLNPGPAQGACPPLPSPQGPSDTGRGAQALCFSLNFSVQFLTETGFEGSLLPSLNSHQRTRNLTLETRSRETQERKGLKTGSGEDRQGDGMQPGQALRPWERQGRSEGVRQAGGVALALLKPDRARPSAPSPPVAVFPW